ncbi:hypothetical protein ACFOPQ_16170 [Deinococcus antarcticus]|uniref:Uncharacterized protein n=1 Tax=Deinococcus antarcticus TaxID=1298767 RepID=A0ABV8ADK5_9DEIO
MKLNPKLLALMTALAAGVAHAAPPTTANPNGYTAAGVPITNTATATFTDPSGTNSTATSNTVSTTVLPLPSFDIVYASGKPDGSGAAATTTDSTSTGVANAASALTPDRQTNVIPGSTVTNAYYLVNNGNVALNVAVAPVVTGVPAANVTYTYVDNVTNAVIAPNPDGTIPLAYGQIIKVTQSIVVPSTAAAGTIIGASPSGSVASTATNGVPSGTLYEDQTVSGGTISTTPANGTDLQYQALQIYTPGITNSPVTPPGNIATPPGGPANTVPGYPGGTPTTTTPPPSGGTSPGTTPIAVNLAGDQQIAYPPADSNATPDVVVFTNTLTNTGPLNDIVTLAPTDANGVTWTKTGTGTYTSNTGVTVQYIDPATGLPTDTMSVPSGGTPVNYYTQVTYPDSNSTNNPTPITVVTAATSGNNPNNPPNLTTDIIYPPAATFGDTAAVPQAPGVVEDPSKAYGPNNTLAPPATTAPGSTASFPMSISNSGQYADTFTLTGYVVIPLSDGTTATVPVVYKDASGNTLTPTSTTTVNGVTVPVYTTAAIAANTTANFTANVTVPANAAFSGSGTAPTLQQTATGTFSTIVAKDTNDVLPIAAAGNVYVGKFTNTGTSSPAINTQAVTDDKGTIVSAAPTAAQVGNPAGYDGINATKYVPQVQYDYMIIGKNSYNSSITNFVLRDTLNSALEYQSAICAVYGPTGALVSTTNVSGIAVGTLGATVACPAVTLPSGAYETLQIFVKIK